MKRLKFVFLSLAVLALSACSTTAYEKGVEGNAGNYKLYSDVLIAQQNTLQECFKHSSDKSQCAILAAGTNATSTLGGRPNDIRVAASPGEIIKSVAEKGFDAAAMIYGFKAVGKALETGFTAAGKDPLVVRPEIVNPVIVGP